MLIKRVSIPFFLEEALLHVIGVNNVATQDGKEITWSTGSSDIFCQRGIIVPTGWGRPAWRSWASTSFCPMNWRCHTTLPQSWRCLPITLHSPSFGSPIPIATIRMPTWRPGTQSTLQYVSCGQIQRDTSLIEWTVDMKYFIFPKESPQAQSLELYACHTT